MSRKSAPETENNYPAQPGAALCVTAALSAQLRLLNMVRAPHLKKYLKRRATSATYAEFDKLPKEPEQLVSPDLQTVLAWAFWYGKRDLLRGECDPDNEEHVVMSVAWSILMADDAYRLEALWDGRDAEARLATQSAWVQKLAGGEKTFGAALSAPLQKEWDALPESKSSASAPLQRAMAVALESVLDAEDKARDEADAAEGRPWQLYAISRTRGQVMAVLSMDPVWSAP